MLIERIRRAKGRSPGEIAHRAFAELIAQADRLRGDPLGETLPGELLERLDTPDVDKLWEDLAARPFPAPTAAIDPTRYDALVPGGSAQIIEAAERVLEGNFTIACCGQKHMDLPIDWHRDPVSGHEWPVRFFRDLDLLDITRNSDVRRVWELSRLQWLIPVGQAYLLTGDERYASFAEAIFDDWMHANHYALGVNWGVAMEPAMRIFVWTWFFHVFAEAKAWTDAEFRARYMAAVFRHAVFVSRHIENWGIGGNHLIADAAGLVAAGHFFGDGLEPKRWARRGWSILQRERTRQVLADGVDFEASLAYHRLTFELFYWAGAYHRTADQEVPRAYVETLSAMAGFTKSATQPTGLVPAWGDSDDARVFTFGGQDVRDHRYVAALDQRLSSPSALVTAGPASAREVIWSIGMDAVTITKDAFSATSRAFPKGGIYVMASDVDHVFADCGAVGFADRGGHGHNDCLSFEAVLDGSLVITDGGTYAYSGDPEGRNNFRGTAAHVTPMIDGAEQSRILPVPDLWRLQPDAVPGVRQWLTEPTVDVLSADHTGYCRLDPPVTPVRLLALDKEMHRLLIADRIEGEGEHQVTVPFPLAVGIVVEEREVGWFRLGLDDKSFDLIVLEADAWQITIEDGWFAPRYGEKQARSVVQFSRDGSLQSLVVGIGPAGEADKHPREWLKQILERAQD